jgi:hypothetical protein
VTARCGGRASVLTHAARHSSDAAVAPTFRGGDAEGVLSVRRWRGGELDKGRINVAMRHTQASQRTPATRLCARAGKATPGSRRRAFGHASSASGAAYSRTSSLSSQLQNPTDATVMRADAGRQR